MGLKVEGYGALPSQVMEALQPREDDLESVLNLPLERIEIPNKKKDLQKLAAELDRQIEVLKPYENAQEPKVQADAKHLLRLAREARLDIEGRLLSWAVSDVEDQNRVLSSDEASAIFALFGPTLSQGEMNYALSVLDAHLAPEDRKAEVNELVDATVASADKVGKRTSGTSRKVFTARVGPVLGGLLASRALGAMVALDPAVGLAVNLAAIQAGFQIGTRTGAQAVKNEAFAFGVGRFEGESDHDLVYLQERLTQLHQKLWKMNDADGQDLVNETVALTRFLTQRRKETWANRDDVSEVERQAVARFEQVADLLDEKGVAGARGRIDNLGVKSKQLAKIPSLPDMLQKPVDGEKTQEAFQTMVAEASKSCLSVTNMPLKRLISMLEDRHLADGSKLDAGEAAAIQRFVGDAPSVAEVFALSRLSSAGVLDLQSLWPDGRIIGHDGKDISQEDAKLLFETLGDRKRGGNIAKLGRAIGLVAPFLAAGAAFLGAALIPGAPGIMSLLGVLNLAGGIGGSLATHIGGFFLGRYVENKGEAIKLQQGLNVPTAIGNEYAMLLPRLTDPDTLLAGSLPEVKERLSAEADVLDVVVKSVVRTQENLKKALFELEQAGPPADVQEAQAREVLSRLLSGFEQSKRTHYDVLSAVRDELRKHVQNDDSLEQIRSGFADIRSSMYDLMPITWGDIVLSQTEQEIPQGKAIFYQRKMDLIDQLGNWDGSGIAPNDVVKAAEAYDEIREALPKKDRPAKDAVDDVAKKIRKGTLRREDATKVTRPQFVDRIKTQRIADLAIGQERAEEIGQEVLNALWSQLYPAYGLVPDGLEDVEPRFRKVEVTTIPNEDPTQFPSYQVKGQVDRGGHLAFDVDAAGRISPNLAALDLDLGDDRLGKMAETAVARHLEAATGVPPTQVRSELKGREADGTRTFRVSTNAGSFSVRIDARGMLDNESIKAQ